MQHQHRNRRVLHRDQRRLAVRAEGEPRADVVAERDEESGGFEQVGGEGEPLGGARLEKGEELWDLDDGGEGDDGQGEGFGDGEREAGGVGGVEVEDEDAVAGGAEERGAEVLEGGGEGVG